MKRDGKLTWITLCVVKLKFIVPIEGDLQRTGASPDTSAGPQHWCPVFLGMLRSAY